MDENRIEAVEPLSIRRALAHFGVALGAIAVAWLIGIAGCHSVAGLK